MQQLSALAKRMMTTILVLVLLFAVAAAVYYRSIAVLPFFWGLVLGTGVSLWKVWLLDRAVDRALAMEKTKAGNYVSIQHMLRLGITGVVLVLGAVVPRINLWGVAAGIMAFQLALYVSQMKK